MDTPTAAPDRPKTEIYLTDVFSVVVDWFRYFLRKWWLILLAAIIGGALGIYLASRDLATYESRLTFALDDGSGDAGGVSSIAAQFGINIGGSGKSFFSGDNITEILKSRRIIEAVLLSSDTLQGKPEKLIQHFLNFSAQKSGKPYAGVMFPLSLQKASFSYQQDSILSLVSNDFATQRIQAARPDRRLDIYEVKVVSPNEHFTKVFTDRILQETINFYTALRIKKSKETLDILEERVASMKGNLNSSINTKSVIQDDNLNPAFSKAAVPLQKQNVNIQVYSGAYSEMFKNLELARFQYLKEIPLLQIIDAADYPMKKIKMGKLSTGIKFAFIFTFLVIILLIASRYIRKIL